MLYSIDRELITDISGQPVNPIFKGQAVHEECWEHLGTQLRVYREWHGQWLVLREFEVSQYG